MFKRVYFPDSHFDERGIIIQFIETNNNIRKAMKQSNVKWTEQQCDNSVSLTKNNTKREYLMINNIQITKQENNQQR